MVHRYHAQMICTVAMGPWYTRCGHMVCTFAVWTWYMATVPPRCVWLNVADKETDCQQCLVITAGTAEVGRVRDILGATDLSAKQLISAPMWPRYLYQVGTVSVYHGCTATIHVATVHRYHTHTVCTVTMWLWYTDIVPRQDVWLLCGHSTRMPWPHGMYNCCVDTVNSHRATMWCMVAMWPRYLYQVGMVSVYRGHTETVGMVLARCWYTVATWQPYVWALYRCTVATRQQYTLCGHSVRIL